MLLLAHVVSPPPWCRHRVQGCSVCVVGGKQLKENGDKDILSLVFSLIVVTVDCSQSGASWSAAAFVWNRLSGWISYFIPDENIFPAPRHIHLSVSQLLHHLRMLFSVSSTSEFQQHSEFSSVKSWTEKSQTDATNICVLRVEVWF